MLCGVYDFHNKLRRSGSWFQHDLGLFSGGGDDAQADGSAMGWQGQRAGEVAITQRQERLGVAVEGFPVPAGVEFPVGGQGFAGNPHFAGEAVKQKWRFFGAGEKLFRPDPKGRGFFAHQARARCVDGAKHPFKKYVFTVNFCDRLCSWLFICYNHSLQNKNSIFLSIGS